MFRKVLTITMEISTVCTHLGSGPTLAHLIARIGCWLTARMSGILLASSSSFLERSYLHQNTEKVSSLLSSFSFNTDVLPPTSSTPRQFQQCLQKIEIEAGVGIRTKNVYFKYSIGTFLADYVCIPAG
jgi:hypothetical protein